MEELLGNPAVQGGVAPFLAGLLVAGLLFPARLGGLSAGAAVLIAVYLTGNFAFEPLTSMRKLVAVGIGAMLLGALADLAFKPGRATGIVLGILFGAASAWVFWTLLAQREAAQAMLVGGGVAALVLWLVAFTTSLHADSVRAGAAGLGLGLGGGIAAFLSASLVVGLYGIALAAGSGAFLVLVMILGRRVAAGQSLTLSVAVFAGLLGAAAMLLAKLPWYALAALAATPLAARLPVPDKSPAWAQAIVASIYTLTAGAGACWLAWLASRGAEG